MRAACLVMLDHEPGRSRRGRPSPPQGMRTATSSGGAQSVRKRERTNTLHADRAGGSTCQPGPGPGPHVHVHRPAASLSWPWSRIMRTSTATVWSVSPAGRARAHLQGTPSFRFTAPPTRRVASDSKVQYPSCPASHERPPNTCFRRNRRQCRHSRHSFAGASFAPCRGAASIHLAPSGSFRHRTGVIRTAVVWLSAVASASGQSHQREADEPE